MNSSHLKEKTYMRARLCILLVVTLALSLIAYGDCPNCHNDQIPMAGHGAAPDGSGRHNVNVQLEFNGAGSWTDPSTGRTNDNIWNGVQNASTDWNNATTGTGQATNYYFNVNQGTASGDVDVRIVLGNPGTGALASTDGKHSLVDGTVGPPYTITLPPDAKNWSAAKLQSVIAHELGHTIGLSHAYLNFRTCGHTIMNHTAPSGGRITGSVQPQDVAEANKQYNNRAACSDWFGQKARPTDDGGGYTEPDPWRYTPTCYYFYDAVPVYRFCDCNSFGAPRGYEQVGTIYHLTDSFCF
jgi:Dual-action HEIGH metallo-peptidase